jgi:ABC-2 type transport system permease protein
MKFLPIVKKDLKVLIKDKGALIVLFILPIMFISIMSFALKPVFNSNGDNVIDIIVINLDSSKESKDFIRKLSEVEGLKVISKIDGKTVSEQDAKSKIIDGKYPMDIIIPKGFGDKVVKGQKVSINSFQDPEQSNTNSVIIKAIEGEVRTFSVNFTISNLVDDQIKGIQDTVNSKINDMQNSYQQSFDDEINNISKQTGISIPKQNIEPKQKNDINYDSIKKGLQDKAGVALVKSNVSIQSQLDNSKKASRPDSFQQNVPGYTVMFAFFIVMFAGRSFIIERNQGTFKRILGAPVGRWSLFLGKFIPNYIIGIAQTIVMFSVGHFIFGMSLGNSIIGLCLVSIVMIWASTSLGMLIASLVRTESQVVGVSMLIVLTLAALGGTMVPLFIMPDIMQKIAYITPHAWALTAYQNLLVRGMDISGVLPNILALFSFGLLFIIISIWRLRFND